MNKLNKSQQWHSDQMDLKGTKLYLIDRVINFEYRLKEINDKIEILLDTLGKTKESNNAPSREEAPNPNGEDFNWTGGINLDGK